MIFTIIRIAVAAIIAEMSIGVGLSYRLGLRFGRRQGDNTCHQGKCQ